MKALFLICLVASLTSCMHTYKITTLPTGKQDTVYYRPIPGNKPLQDLRKRNAALRPTKVVLVAKSN